MQKLYKRGKIYYFRTRVDSNLQKYFNNKEIYIRSLKTHNKNNAKLIVKYLSAKLSYIQSSYMQLTHPQIKAYIEEFKKVHFQDIINRNSCLQVEQINQTIEELNSEVGIYDEIIKSELYDLMQMLHNNYQIVGAVDLDTQDFDYIKSYIIQIKINALNEVKKEIQSTIAVNTNTSTFFNSSDESTTICIKEAVDEYMASRTGITDKVNTANQKNLDKLITYLSNEVLKWSVRDVM